MTRTNEIFCDFEGLVERDSDSMVVLLFSVGQVDWDAGGNI